MQKISPAKLRARKAAATPSPVPKTEPAKKATVAKKTPAKKAGARKR